MEQSLKDDLAKLRRKLFFKTCEEVCKQSGSKKDEDEELKTVVELFLKLLIFLALRFKHKNAYEYITKVLYDLWFFHHDHREEFKESFEEELESLKGQFDD